ncbi:hypothetical protein ACWGBO_34340 [[Kitasatospora] papulosa]
MSTSTLTELSARTRAEQQLGSHLLRMVREADARIPEGRRAPRTAAEMRARINIAANQACGSCSGAGGRVVDSSSDGVSRQHWESCTACAGTGVAR